MSVLSGLLLSICRSTHSVAVSQLSTGVACFFVPSCNSSDQVDVNIRNSDTCLRVVVVLVVRIVVTDLLLANSVVIVVRNVLVLVANSGVVDTIEVVVLIVLVVAVDTVEIAVDTVANYLVVAAEVVVVADANFVVVVAVVYLLIDQSNSEPSHVVSLGRAQAVARLPEPQLTLVCLEVP